MHVNLPVEQVRLLRLYLALADHNGSFRYDFQTIRERTGLPASLIIAANQKLKEMGLLRLLARRRNWLKLDRQTLKGLGIPPTNPTLQTVREAA